MNQQSLFSEPRQPVFSGVQELKFAPLPTGRNFEDLTGKVFQYRTVLGFAGRRGNRRMWYSECVCGRISVTERGSLKKSESCGCVALASKPRNPNAPTSNPLYATWKNMISRCTKPNNKSYKDYGGRGITVCDRWQSFENFLADMGPRPTAKHSIDRVDNDKGYSPDNCVWATREEQCSHTRNSRLLTFQGRTQSMPAWCRELNLSYELVETRINQGWTAEDAFLLPPMRPRQRSRIKKEMGL